METPKVPEEVIVEPMQANDVKECLQLFAENQLAESIAGLASFRAIDPDGYWIARDVKTGRVLAMCGGSKFDPRAAYIGFYATRPELHGRGLGIKCWRKVIEYIGPENNTGLCATPSQIKVYKEKAGFVHHDPHFMSCYDLPPGKTVDIDKLSSEDIPGVTVKDMVEELLLAVIQYDKELIGLDRGPIIRLSVTEDTARTVVATVASGAVAGYGTIKWSNMDNGMLGPLYADTPQIAELILCRLLQKYPEISSKGIHWMVLATNTAACEMAERIGLNPHLSPRLFTKNVPPSPDVSKIFCIFSPDFSAY